jgi:Flp pilus assembly protein TadB
MRTSRPMTPVLAAAAIAVAAWVLLASSASVGVAVMVVIMAGLPALYRLRHQARTRLIYRPARARTVVDARAGVPRSRAADDAL